MAERKKRLRGSRAAARHLVLALSRQHPKASKQWLANAAGVSWRFVSKCLRELDEDVPLMRQLRFHPRGIPERVYKEHAPTYEPTAEEIAAECLKIRSRWTKEEEEKRRIVKNQPYEIKVLCEPPYRPDVTRGDD